MKFGDYDVPDDLLYTKEHEWAKEAGATVIVGITDYAAKTLNDVVYVTLPKAGEKLTQFKTMGTVESIKAVSELYSPVSGTVTKVNDKLSSQPELTNESPYGDGWLLEVRPTDIAAERKKLMDAKAYSSFLSSITKKV